MSVMVPLLFVLHPHQNVWRWAIYHVSERDLLANPSAGCINAGTQRSKAEADDVGQQCLYTLLSFVAKIGQQTNVTARTYDMDLVPPDVQLSALQISDHVLQMGV